ncbi:MAG: ECF transporter S component [Clostridia bacterium]|nr:ECF transporter S component [Clostridia bacterium]
MSNTPESVREKRAKRTLTLVQLGLLTAIVIVLQLLGSFIRFGPFSVSLVLVPIVLGAVVHGPLAGGWLGLVFALTVLFSGDAALFMTYNPAGAVITVLIKGIAAGVAAGLVYQLCKRINKYVGVLAAAVICPVANTGLFLLGSMIFFYDAMPNIAEVIGVPFPGNPLVFVITVLIGFNFIFELIFNIVLAPAIVRISDLIVSRFRK